MFLKCESKLKANLPTLDTLGLEANKAILSVNEDKVIIITTRCYKT